MSQCRQADLTVILLFFLSLFVALARIHWMSRLRTIWAISVVLILVAHSIVGQADSGEDRRVRTGAKLFRALLAADLGLENRTDQNGQLRVIVLTNDPASTLEVARLIEGVDASKTRTIGGRQLVVQSVGTIGTHEGPVAGIFIASSLSTDKVSQVVQWGITNNTIVYSPFEGDVEKGVLAGLSVEARVRPYLNRKTLDASGIHLKEFFLKVSRMYE